MRIKLLLLGLWSLCALRAYATSTTLQGHAPDYAGKCLHLTYPYDGITEKAMPLATTTVGSNGDFTLTFDLDRTRMVALDLGYYSGRVYAQPGDHLTVDLPPYQALTEAQQFNPYFSPKAVRLSIVRPSADDLNLLIEHFDDLCDSVWTEVLFAPAITPELLEGGINLLEQRFPREEEDFFYRYKRYNYASLVNLYAKASPQLAIETYFAHDSIDFGNPAYWEAFDLIFEQFNQAEALRDNAPLYDLVQASRVIRRKLPVAWLDSLQTPQLQPTITSLRRQLQAGAVGSSVGEGWIGLDGDSIAAADIYGRPTYVMFINRRIFESKSDLIYAAKLANKWQRKCRIVVVFAKEDTLPTQPDKSEAYYLCTQQNPSILEDFGVRNLPSYYLLDGQGHIQQSPAPNPERYIPE